MEWEVFRQAILEQQGWKLHRVWTPHFFRDPKGAVKAILREAPEPQRRSGASADVGMAKPAGRL